MVVSAAALASPSLRYYVQKMQKTMPTICYCRLPQIPGLHCHPPPLPLCPASAALAGIAAWLSVAVGAACCWPHRPSTAAAPGHWRARPRCPPPPLHVHICVWCTFVLSSPKVIHVYLAQTTTGSLTRRGQAILTRRRCDVSPAIMLSEPSRLLHCKRGLSDIE